MRDIDIINMAAEDAQAVLRDFPAWTARRAGHPCAHARGTEPSSRDRRTGAAAERVRSAAGGA